jgi:hypothetical protein
MSRKKPGRAGLFRRRYTNWSRIGVNWSELEYSEISGNERVNANKPELAPISPELAPNGHLAEICRGFMKASKLRRAHDPSNAPIPRSAVPRDPCEAAVPSRSDPVAWRSLAVPGRRPLHRALPRFVAAAPSHPAPRAAAAHTCSAQIARREHGVRPLIVDFVDLGRALLTEAGRPRYSACKPNDRGAHLIAQLSGQVEGAESNPEDQQTAA